MKLKTAIKRLSRQNPYDKPFVYDSLEIIPYKTFLRVADTNDLSLLTNQEIENNVLQAIWDKMWEEHIDYRPTAENKKAFRLHKAIDVYTSKYNQIILYVEALKWSYDDDDFWMVEKIREYGFRFRDDNNEVFWSDIERIEREVNSLLIQANKLKQQLPKQPENGEQEQRKFRIDDLMASYVVITGVGFDFNKITYTAFRGIELQVDAKIKALDAQNNAAKAKTKRR